MTNTDSKPNQRILIVDDNETLHEDFRKILRPRDISSPEMNRLKEVLFDDDQAAAQTTRFELDFAYQGEEGLAMVKKSLAENRPYAMAFVDVRMPPGWDGIETIARMWEVYPQLQIVVCTAYSDYSWEDMRAKVSQPDNLVILKKPFESVEVQQLAHALTNKWLLNVQAEYQARRTGKTGETADGGTCRGEQPTTNGIKRPIPTPRLQIIAALSFQDDP